MRRAAAALLLALAACDGDPGAGDPAIPANHPCPDRALTPLEPRLWTDARSGGPAVPVALVPPTPPGVMVSLSQGNDQDPTHRGVDQWAWDFALPVGAAVHAAADGVVVYVRDDSDRYGPDASYRGDANFVLLDHGGGLFTAYVHLAAGGAEVAPGDPVEAGDRLAVTGLSGQLTGPHLHFHVENAWSESLAAAFVTADAARCDRVPDAGDAVVADPAAAALLVGRGDLSAMPPDAFADLGVTDLNGLPARLLEGGARYRISGRAPAGADRVTALLLPPDGGEAVDAWAFAVTDGAFAGPLRVDVPAGRYGLAFVATAPGEPASVDRAVRVTVR